MKEQILRNSKGNIPKLILNPDKGFWNFTPKDFELINYNPHTNWKNITVAI